MPSPSAPLTYRRATESDVPTIVSLLADDVLGANRENLDTDNADAYRSAFAEIAADPNQYLCVVELEGETVGTMQLTFIPGLSRQGARRGQLEAVRVSSNHRGQGIGEAMIDWAVGQCRERGCSVLQLTTDRQREAAHRFYERLGFVGSHLGFKLEV